MTPCETWADSRLAPRNGTHTTYTRKEAVGFAPRISFRTQLAPARHVAQVGDRRRTNRTDPASLLKLVLSVSMEFRSRTGAADSLPLAVSVVLCPRVQAVARRRTAMRPERARLRTRRLTTATYLVARTHVENHASDLLSRGAPPVQDVHRHTVPLPHQPEQDVLCLDIRMRLPLRFRQRQLEHLLRPWREWDGAGDPVAPRVSIAPPASLPTTGDTKAVLECSGPEGILHAPPHLTEVDSDCSERLGIPLVKTAHLSRPDDRQDVGANVSSRTPKRSNARRPTPARSRRMPSSRC